MKPPDKKVLIVEDEGNIRMLLAATISGFEAITTLEATNGIEALEVAKRERPEIVLLDVLMPEMDGFEVCRHLKMDPDTRDAFVVMVTALAQEHDRARAQEVGADLYMTKPFSPTLILETIDARLDLSS